MCGYVGRVLPISFGYLLFVSMFLTRAQNPLFCAPFALCGNQTALFWWQIPDSTAGVFQRNSLLFFMLIAQANGIVIAAVTVFQRERTLLHRERAKKLYSVSAYFLGKTACDMTNNVIMPIVYCMIVYWTAGYRASAAAYARFVLTFYLTLSTAQSMGKFVLLLDYGVFSVS